MKVFPARGGDDAGVSVPRVQEATGDPVSAEGWRRLASRRFFFGHQSVGDNLMEGVREVLAERRQVRLRVIETSNPADMKAPGFYHARIGRNGAPDSKLDAFAGIAGGLGGSATVLLKYCYVDVNRATDPVALFKGYQGVVDSLRAAQPGLTVVHVTVPLRSDRGAWFHLKTVLRGHGASSDRQLNLKRQRYNTLLREAFGDRDPVFDLAALESISPDGRVSAIRLHGEQVPVLAPEWTADGGHLNGPGRRRMAEAFLALLARLDGGPTHDTGRAAAPRGHPQRSQAVESESSE